MDDEIMVLGMIAGGQQYSDFLRAGEAPWGLSRFIIEAKDKEG